MRKLLFVCALAGALVVAPHALPGSGNGDRVLGSGHFVGDGERDHVAVAARSGPAGEDPRGTIVMQTTNPVTLERQTFQADVSEGCVIVTGNTAIVVGALDEEDFFNVPPPAPQPFLITHLGLVVQEVDEEGRPVDIAQPVFLRTQSAERVCAGTATLLIFTPVVGQFHVDDAEVE